MKTTKRIVYVMCGVLALSLLFHAPTPVQASTYGTYGYSVRNSDGTYSFFDFDEDLDMYSSLNNCLIYYQSYMRQLYPSFHWYYDYDTNNSSDILGLYISEELGNKIHNINLSNPEFLVNLLISVNTSNVNNVTAQVLLYITKNNSYQYSYDTVTYNFSSMPFLCLRNYNDGVVTRLNMFPSSLQMSNNSSVSQNQYGRSFVYGGNLATYLDSEFDTAFTTWFNSDYNSVLIYKKHYSTGTKLYLMYYDTMPSESFNIHPLVIQSRIYKLTSGYTITEEKGYNGDYYSLVYADSTDYLNEIPFSYLAEPFSTYINTPYATPTPIPTLNPEQIVVLPTGTIFETPTPIPNITLPALFVADGADPFRAGEYAINNIVQEFTNPVYAIMSSVISILFYNSIWFKFLLIIPCIAFFVFMIGRLRKK